MIKIDPSPSIGMLNVLKSVEYKSWFAIAEFIDNSIQSYLNHQEKLNDCLTVKIDIQPDKITITDDAAGIFEHEYTSAFTVAVPPNFTEGLSEFGMGMKNAAAWFGDLLVVTSTAVGENITRVVNYNIPEIVKEMTADPNYRIIPEEHPQTDIKHGTTIELRELNQKIQGNTHAKIRDHLASIFRKFIRKGILNLQYRTGNNEFVTLEFEEIKIRKSAPSQQSIIKSKNTLGSEEIEWKKSIDMDLGQGQRAHGFVALASIGSSTGTRGFALFRRNRLIEGSNDYAWSPYRAATTGPAQRIFGELEMEGFAVTYTKEGFRWDANQDSSEEIFTELLVELIDSDELPLETEARKAIWRNEEKQDNKKVQKTSLEAAKDTALEMGSTGSEALEKAIPIITNTQSPQLPDLSSVYGVDSFEIKLGLETWKIQVRVIAETPNSENWFQITDNDSIAKTATISLVEDHVFTQRFLTNLDVELIHPFTRLATAIGVASLKFKTHESPDQLMRDFNSILTYLGDPN